MVLSLSAVDSIAQAQRKVKDYTMYVTAAARFVMLNPTVVWTPCTSVRRSTPMRSSSSRLSLIFSHIFGAPSTVAHSVAPETVGCFGENVCSTGAANVQGPTLFLPSLP